MPPKLFGGMAARLAAAGRDAKAKESPLQAEPSHTVIAFSSVEFLCWEDDGEVSLTVVRRGAAATRVQVHWSTHNESLPDRCYMAQEGVVTMEKGAREVTFPMKILNNQHWDIEGRIRVDLKLEDSQNVDLSLLEVVRKRALASSQNAGGMCAYLGMYE